MSIITLTTDFGSDFYVAEIKGVIFSVNPNVRVVDVTHNIDKQNVFDGAFIISEISWYFPKNTIHVGVVDPGVGSRRKEVIVQTDRAYFIGPDNGIFSLATKNQKIKNIFEIDYSKLKKFYNRKISKTFHGRDIFAPTAALISRGIRPDGLGNRINEIKKLELPMDRVIHIDDFGNVITSIDKEFDFNDKLLIRYKNKKIKAHFLETFSNARAGEILVLRGSHGFLEIAINERSAAKKLGFKVGDSIKIVRYN